MVHCAVVDFPTPRFPSAKAAASTSYSSSRPPATAPKQPAAKPAAAKASAASRASAAKAYVSKPASKVQVVDTVSDDDSDEDDMPSLVTSDESDQEQSQERPAKRTPPASRDPSEGKVSPAGAAKGKQVPLDVSAKGKAVPSASVVKGKPVPSAVSKGKPAPSAVPTEGKQSSVIAHGEPMFKPVSRGYLAEQSAIWAAYQGQPNSAERKTNGSALPKGASSSSEQKQTASGTDFSFDRAISGGSKGTFKQTPPTAASAQMLGKHADSFVHYKYDSSGVTSEDEVLPDQSVQCRVSVRVCSQCVCCSGRNLWSRIFCTEDDQSAYTIEREIHGSWSIVLHEAVVQAHICVCAC